MNELEIELSVLEIELQRLEIKADINIAVITEIKTKRYDRGIEI